MILKKWDDMPENLKNDIVLKYYNILKKKQLQLILKRIFDIIMSLILIILLSPAFLIVAIAIKIDSKGPIFYRQERITQYGKIFKIFKFRTMVQDADKKGSLVTLSQDSRITRVGERIRGQRIDEIPQLFNVFLGDMTFVGTRPEVKKYVDKYTDEMLSTLLLPAGVTSKASIEYKDEDEIISTYLEKNEGVDEIYINRVLPEKMKKNIEYMEQFNLMQDLKLCIKTAVTVSK